jgi:hypothetical protein
VKFLKVAAKAGVCIFFGAMATAYAVPRQREKQAEPAAREAKPQQQQQRAQQPKQAQPQQQQRAQQPKQEAKPQQRKVAQQPRKEAKPQQQKVAQQPKQEAKPQQQKVAQRPKQAAKPQQQKVAQQPRQEAKPQQQKVAQQPKQAAKPQQQRQNAYAPPQRSTQQARSWQQKSGWRSQGAWQGRASFQQNRSSHWASDHRTWAQRGGYGGYYIPQASFGLYFGVGHWFRIGSQPVIVGGYPEFQYGGYTFMLVDPWPEDWAENWYDTDELYIGYDNGYYLYDRMHPGEAVAIVVVIVAG